MISITSAPEAPPPRIRIVDSRGREVETVRIGDKLTFRIEIPDDSMCNFCSIGQKQKLYQDLCIIEYSQ
jgi:hypothetical protein